MLWCAENSSARPHSPLVRAHALENNEVIHLQHAHTHTDEIFLSAWHAKSASQSARSRRPNRRTRPFAWNTIFAFVCKLDATAAAARGFGWVHLGTQIRTRGKSAYIYDAAAAAARAVWATRIFPILYEMEIYIHVYITHTHIYAYYPASLTEYSIVRTQRKYFDVCGSIKRTEPPPFVAKRKGWKTCVRAYLGMCSSRKCHFRIDLKPERQTTESL